MTISAINSSTLHRCMLLKKWPTGLVCHQPTPPIVMTKPDTMAMPSAASDGSGSSAVACPAARPLRERQQKGGGEDRHHHGDQHQVGEGLIYGHENRYYTLVMPI